ncbi:ATP-binding protein [Sedimentibacter sp.]|uniref:sensor histidine kinase n=1 Tax=Sedimentibacter sp. TaxID=1960295 RepID=UPI0028A7DF18|nr:ATP-binding protein [Sedimentibacter sp.]
MKNKIAVKLTAYFSVTLLTLSIIIGIVFVNLFKNNAVEIHKKTLENRALTIAQTIFELTEGTGLNFVNMMHGRGMGMMMQGGLGVYLRNLDDIAMADAWIVDENLNLLTTGTMSHMQYRYQDLPEDADVVVKSAFSGSTTFSEGFSQLLNTSTITVGTPIKTGNITIGVLLLHSPVKGIEEAAEEGYKILSISILTALLLSLILSVVMALTFTKPLKKINDTALLLSEGNYTVKTDVNQKDEIGELAGTIDELSQRLDTASRESEKLQSQRQDFITNISHELRTPVTVIRGSLEALNDGIIKEPEAVKEYHKQMLSESKSLERLVNDLLELSRLQNTDFKIEMQEINICDVLRDTVKSAYSIAKDKNIEIKYSMDCDLCVLNGDYGRLRQMFLIVIENAIKFSLDNGKIQVNFDGEKIDISDEGIGIHKEDLPYIFDRYYRVKTVENKKGTGLGLTIAKQIALRHNIDIKVISEQNKGTTFTFELPINFIK